MKAATCAYAALAAFLLPAILLSAGVTPSQGPHWEIAGQLSEACSCSVPCSCNFGQGASPHHYCWSMMSFYIEKGYYGSVKLDGLHLAGAHGKGGRVWYIDDRATPEQEAALKAI